MQADRNLCVRPCVRVPVCQYVCPFMLLWIRRKRKMLSVSSAWLPPTQNRKTTAKKQQKRYIVYSWQHYAATHQPTKYRIYKKNCCLQIVCFPALLTQINNANTHKTHTRKPCSVLLIKTLKHSKLPIIRNINGNSCSPVRSPRRPAGTTACLARASHGCQ